MPFAQAVHGSLIAYQQQRGRLTSCLRKILCCNLGARSPPHSIGIAATLTGAKTFLGREETREVNVARLRRVSEPLDGVLSQNIFAVRLIILALDVFDGLLFHIPLPFGIQIFTFSRPFRLKSRVAWRVPSVMRWRDHPARNGVGSGRACRL